MNDLVLLGISMSGVVLLIGLVLFFITERQASKRALELKMFQMENTRLIQEWRKDTVAHLKTMGLRVEQIYEILGKDSA
jgi:1,2-phenylacetyl-CoA epoxidase catalytic subunit